MRHEFCSWNAPRSAGPAKGTFGWPSYPAAIPSTLDFTNCERGDYWLQPRWKQAWVPDAFRGTMGELLIIV